MNNVNTGQIRRGAPLLLKKMGVPPLLIWPVIMLYMMRPHKGNSLASTKMINVDKTILEAKVSKFYLETFLWFISNFECILKRIDGTFVRKENTHVRSFGGIFNYIIPFTCISKYIRSFNNVFISLLNQRFLIEAILIQ